MSGKGVEYHRGAIADVKSAVAWYQQHSPKVALDFIEELHRAADTIREAPERWTIPALAIPVRDSRVPSPIPSKHPQSQSGPLPSAGDRSIGHVSSKPWFILNPCRSPQTRRFTWKPLAAR
jgi:plasmid stabilization system protein ParE